MSYRSVVNSLITLALILWVAVWVPPTDAQIGNVIFVNSLDDTAADDGQCSLREAITAANSNAASGAGFGECAAGLGDDVIDLTGLNGTINLSGPLPNLSSDMIIEGPAANVLTIRRDSGGDYRLFTINPGNTITLSGMTLANGRVFPGNGGGISNAGTLTLNSVTLHDNEAVGDDGGLSGGGFGGGIYNSGTLTVLSSTFDRNQATGGTGATGSATGAGGGGGGGAGLGGAIFNQAGTVNVTNSTLSANRALGGDGGAGLPNAGDFTGTGSNGGGAGGQGGSPGNPGTAGQFGGGGGGGGGDTFGSAAGGAGGYGGGGGGGGGRTSGGVGGNGGSGGFGAGAGGTATFSAAGGGGGGAGLGGGIFNNGGSFTINSSTLANNTAQGGAGASGSFGFGNGQNGTGLGGGILTNGGTVNLQNSLIFDNSADSDANCNGTINSQGFNLVGTDTGCLLAGPGDLTTANAIIGPLSDNGGSTATHALLPGSPAIDAGDDATCPATDQRGQTRPGGQGCDIGAFELAQSLVDLSTNSLSFGDQELFTSSGPQSVMLTNLGNIPLTIDTISLSGDFEWSHNCPLTPATLAVNASCLIQIVFTPTAVGDRVGTLTIESDAPGTPHTVDLAGSGEGGFVAVGVDPIINKVYQVNQGDDAVVIFDEAGGSITTVPAGTAPGAIAVNPTTNKAYVANRGSNNVTIIDGTDDDVMTLHVGAAPVALAVNPVTNKIYVANFSDNSVSIINGAISSVEATRQVGTEPAAVAINPVTNKIYVANQASGTVTVLDGTNNQVVETVSVGAGPAALAVNPVTNKIYVANGQEGTVSVIDGSTDNVEATVPVGAQPGAITVNSVTNKIYVANSGSASVTIIAGATNGTANINVGARPVAVGVNSATNRVYVANRTGDSVTVIAEDDSFITTLPAEQEPLAVGINPVTGQIFVVNRKSPNLTQIDGANATPPLQPSPLTVAITSLPDDTSFTAHPNFTFSASSGFGPVTPPISQIYYQVDSLTGSWLRATPAGQNASGVTPPLQNGLHTIYAFATDGQEATSINKASSPILGQISTYEFEVLAPTATAPASLSFGPQTVASASALQVVDFLNDGPVPLTINDIVIDGNYGQTNNCPSILAVGQSCTVSVTFNPSTTGLNSGQLTFVIDDAAASTTVDLAGSGTPAPFSPAVNLEPESLDFKEQGINTPSEQLEIILENTGSIELPVEDMELMVSSLDFEPDNRCDEMLNPGESCAIGVTFIPQSSGEIAGRLVILNEDAPGSPHQIELEGEGIGSTLFIVNRAEGQSQETTFTFSLFKVENDTPILLGEFDLENGEIEERNNLGPGSYLIAEAVPDGWHLRQVTCSNAAVVENPNPPDVTVDLGIGQEISCTFINDGSGMLEVVKNVEPDDLDSAWQIDVSGPTLFNGTLQGDATTGGLNVGIGTYTISETAEPGFSLDDYATSHECTVDGDPLLSGEGPTIEDVPVGPGDDVVCTFTNQRVTGSLTVIKNVEPDNPNTTWQIDVSGPTPFSDSLQGDDATDTQTVMIGDYSITETVGDGLSPDDFSTTYECLINGDQLITGQGPSIDTITVDPGDEVICTFINTRITGTLQVVKNVDPDDPNTIWEIDVSGPTPFDAVLQGDGTTEAVSVLSGSYSITEAAGAGLSLDDYVTSFECQVNGQPSQSGQGPTIDAVQIAPGDEVICIFTNTGPSGQLEVVKALVPAVDPGRFDLLIDGIVRIFDAGDGDSTGAQQVSVGAHLIAEAGSSPASDLDGYDKSIACVDAVGNPVSAAPQAGGASWLVGINEGDAVLCTITNESRPTAIDLISFEATAATGAVILTWQTGTEIDNAGFNLYRATVEAGPYTRINSLLIPASGDPVAGASYSYTDPVSRPSKVYYYKLEDVDTQGVSTFHGPIEVEKHPSIYLPIVVK